MKPASLLAILLLIPSPASAATPDYAVVASQATQQDAGWAAVISALVEKHQADVVVYDASVGEALPALRAKHPRYTCFVARPAEATRPFVAEVHRLTRQYDDDPYADTLWGILTGYDAENALRIARHAAPLTVRKVASGTEVALEMCAEGVWYCELTRNRMVRKAPGGSPAPEQGPDDTTKALADTLNTWQADLFVTSGHATERDWQIGYRYKNGTFRSKAGSLFGMDTKGERVEIHSPTPKVYLPIGNCLMGHIDGPDAMALAWMSSAGVHQMIGYTVPTWYGYAGWGCLDYFVEQPGRYTFVEAFHANQHALVHRIATLYPDLSGRDVPPGSTRKPSELTAKAKAAGLSAQDGAGLLHDRDVVALYGDPKWAARMAPAGTRWEQALTEQDGLWTFTVKPRHGVDSFKPFNTNGAQRGGRPIVQLFDARLTDIRIREGQDLDPAFADDVLLVPLPKTCDPDRTYRVTFTAKRVDNR
jgi:zinc protease